MIGRIKRKERHAFSLVELVIVVVIIAIIGAIAIPRMSRGSQGAADSALAGNLSILRTAVDLYQTEHGGSYPTLAQMSTNLTLFSDVTGANTSATKNTASGIVYGPYLRAIPPLPVGANKGGTGFVAAYTAPPGAGTPTNGWVYDSAGNITANTTTGENDSNGKAYSAY